MTVVRTAAGFGPTRTAVPRYGSQDEVLGLPARAVALTNSERSNAYCPTKWYLGAGLGLSSPSTPPMRFGTAGHEALEDIYRWWMTHDVQYPEAALDACLWCPSFPRNGCPHCGGTGLGPIPRIEARWFADVVAGRRSGSEDEDGAADEEEEEIPRRVERLRRVLQDYLHTYGGGYPFPDYRVVGVELTIAMPIVPPGRSEPYAPEAFVYERPDGSWRFARPGDDRSRVTVQRIPCYLVGKLDAVIAHRTTNRLWVVEHKLNASPDTFLRGITVDPQTAGYTQLLDYASGLGGIPSVPQWTPAGGALFDLLASGYHYDPEPLKSGGFSVAKRTVPSWRFERALATAHAANPLDPKMDPARYVDHLRHLRDTVDPKLYRRESVSVGVLERARFMRELYTDAVQIAAMRRDVYRRTSPDEVAVAFPRRPICRLPGGSCGFRGPCAADGPDARRAYAVSDGQTWNLAQVPLLSSASTETPTDNTPKKDDDTPWL